jgi:hypothetical protein
MVINDCLDHLSIVTRTMERIDRIEGFVHPLTQGALV